jgi:2-oxoglutarate ferredoxin oxidoreductase subunit beta
MLQWQRDHAVTAESASRLKPDEMEDKFLIGVLADRELPVYTEEYERVRQRAKLGQGKKA